MPLADDTTMQTLGIFLKQPKAGRVKTRLGRHLGMQRAADIYAAFIHDIITRFCVMADRRYLCHAQLDAENYFQSLAGEDYELWPQPEGSLGERMSAFFHTRLRNSQDRAVIIGTDSPTLPASYVETAFEELQRADCVLGPATDGGYYLVGFRARPLPIFDDIPWSTPEVLESTMQRLESLDVQFSLLPPWYDVDTPDDWQMLQGHVRALRRAQSPLNLDAVSQFLDLDGKNG